MKITVELETPEQAAALYRLCEKITHADAMEYLYGHKPKEIRVDQAYQVLYATAAVQTALEEAGVTSAFPWIETGRAT